MFTASNLLLVIEIVFSIVLPLWLYRWISKQVKDQRSSCLELRNTISDVHFLLKRWWAQYCIIRQKKKLKNPQTSKYGNIESIRLKDQDSIDSHSFYAVDQKGNSLFVKFCQKTFKVAEVSLYLTTVDGQFYVLPSYPDTMSTSSLNQEWLAAGLKIEFLEHQQRWRIVYNGMLKNLSKSIECSEESLEHIRLNFIFIAFSPCLRWPEDWSSKLHSEALACEPWRNPEWVNKIRLLDYKGTDHWGSMMGQITYKNGSVSTLYLRGLHQHRWGKHESCEFHESVTLIGIMSYGAMFYLSMSSTKHSFSQIQFGQYRSNSENIMEIEQIGLKLSDFAEEKFHTDKEYKTWFVSHDGRHDVSVKLNDSLTMYHGQQWNWQNKLFTVRLEMDGKSGLGQVQLSSPYIGPTTVKQPKQLKLLKNLSTSVQKDDYILYFDDGKCQAENIVGGKGYSLAILSTIQELKFTVPSGFCVTVFAFELQLQTYRELRKIINDIEDISTGKLDEDLQAYCNKAMNVIESTPIVVEVKDAISKAIEKLESQTNSKKGTAYAVRSSAVGEDSEETSAAGQNSTYLGVRGTDNILKKVAMCWASLYSYHSVKYRKQHGMFVKASMGVCIQQMVNADIAGVMFTRHPTTGDPSKIIITANYGLGESVVSAAIEPDTITVHKSWDDQLTVESSVVGTKKEKFLAEDNEVKSVPLDKEESGRICLPEQISLQLAAIGVRLETLYGSARDIEWAVVGKDIYLLQARPITTLYTWTDFEITHELDSGVPSDIDLFTFANVGEVLPNAESPLTLSIIRKTFDRGVAHVYNVSNITSFHIVAMRIAVNYYNVFLREPSEEITLLHKAADIAIAGNVMITPEINKVACERNGLITKQRQLWRIFRMIIEVFQQSVIEKTAKKIRENMTLNADNFNTAYSLYDEINQKLTEYIRVAECHMQTSRVNIHYQLFAMALLTQGYEDLVPEHFSDIAVLLSSCSDIVSGEVVKSLQKIITYIKKYEKEEAFREKDPKKVLEWLKINCPPAADELNYLLKEHGHRCIQELDFYSEPWCLRPEDLVRTLQVMAMASENRSNLKKVLSPEETVSLLKTPKSALSKWILKKIIPYCRRAVVCREMTKGIFVSVVHTFRLAFRRLGKLMMLEGYLPSEDLVFFLTNKEIREVLHHRDTSLVQKAIRRKRIFPHLQKTQYPENNIGMPLPLKSELDITVDDESVKIEGTPVCGGSILSRACVITDIADAHKVQQGDILITHSTDIAWSPYFPLLSGVVTELGGLISHGAVVAREYGLPCIVGAKRSTQVFQTGDIVLLAADTGVLQLVKKFN